MLCHSAPIFVIDPLVSRQQPREIDPCDYLPVLRRNSCDSIRVSDISVDISLDVFELVELVNNLVSIPDDDVMSLIEGVWIVESGELRCRRW